MTKQKSVKLSVVFGDISSPSVGAGLETLRLGEEPSIIVLFTDDSECLETHFVKYANLQGELQCNADGEGSCVLCQVTKGPDTRYLLPVYDVSEAQVKVLRISTARQAYSLGPQIREQMRKGALAERYVTIVRNAAKYEVGSISAEAGQEMGEREIKCFLDRCKDGEIDLIRSVDVVPNA